MALAGRKETNEVRFCWERVLRTNRLFRVSRVFAPTDRAGQLLPLYALFGTVEELCSEHTDVDVARRKLDWWRSEISRLGEHGSDHPILLQLVRSGAHESLDSDSLARMFNDAESRLDPKSPADIDDLRARCLSVSHPRFELELSLWGARPATPQMLDAIAATCGLAQLMREAARRPVGVKYWWLPLSMLARHGVGRADLGSEPPSPQVQALFADILAECHDWCRAHDPRGVGVGRDGVAFRHLFVMGQLQASALRRLQPDRPGNFASELGRIGLPQLHQAWKTARRFGAADGSREAGRSP
jgi:phytoene/squalene synthetase